jgi:putative SOS response-associated peptidase YedK
MCRRFTCQERPQLIAEIFGLPEFPTIHPRYNIAPTQKIPIIRQHVDGQNYLAYMQWGLIPSWMNYRSVSRRMINARSETVAEKPAFLQAVRNRRCLVVASGYYEWEQGKKATKPIYVHCKDNGPMIFAGLWEIWNSPDGEAVESCAILTTVSNQLIKPHRSAWSIIDPPEHRMPVILNQDEYQTWLDPNITDPASLVHLYRPFPVDLMEMFSVSPLVNNPKNDSAKLIAPV